MPRDENTRFAKIDVVFLHIASKRIQDLARGTFETLMGFLARPFTRIRHVKVAQPFSVTRRAAHNDSHNRHAVCRHARFNGIAYLIIVAFVIVAAWMIFHGIERIEAQLVTQRLFHIPIRIGRRAQNGSGGCQAVVIGV